MSKKQKTPKKYKSSKKSKEIEFDGDKLVETVASFAQSMKKKD